jgi:NAD(P)-dependent dehydrogenase (short-subunit alcohol dehydrogenase family)
LSAEPRESGSGPLSGRVAVVVGASSGIGEATARMFADAGAQVHAAARRRPSVGERVAGHELDVSDRAGVDRFARDICDAGPVHAVVVAAGLNIPDRSLDRLTPEGFDQLVSVNLTGAFNVVHAFLDAIRATRGDVVLIGSVSGSWPDVSGSGYQAAKAGLLAFGRGAGFEEHNRGVRFTTIMPGVVDTPILDQRPEPPSPELRAHMLKPEDVAAACLFAVSLPPRAHVPELTILPTVLQAIGKTNVANPELPDGS